MKEQDKTASAILFGVLFIIIMKIFGVAGRNILPVALSSNATIVTALSGFLGATFSFLIVRQFFPSFLK